MTSRRTLYTKCAFGLLCAIAINLPAQADLPVSTTNVALPALSAASSFKPDTVVPNEVLVKFGSAISAQDMTPTLNTMASSVKQINRSGLTLVKLTPGTETISSAMATLRAIPGVVSVQPNFLYHSTALPNDPEIGQQWALKNDGVTPILNATYATNNPGTAGDDIDAESAWQYQSDCSSVTVAVVDTGINYTQQDLVNSMWNGGTSYPNHGYDFVDNDNDPYPTTGDELHATHVAGIIGAEGNNGIEGSGVCQKASIMSVRVLNAAGGSTATVVQGVYFAVNNGARIINMSLGGNGGFDQAFSDAISYAQSKGVLVVVAAGNGDSNGNGVNVDQTPFYPCDFTQDNLICVAALDQSFQLASFSNYGATSVDVGAPGTNILSTIAGPSTTTDFSGWSSNLSPTGWKVGSATTNSGVVIPTLSNPNYASGTDDQVWASFTFPGSNVQFVALSYYLQGNMATGDYFNSGVTIGNNVDPFAGTGTLLKQATGSLSSPPSAFPINQCAGRTCSIGFQLTSTASSPSSTGPLVALFNLNTVEKDTNATAIEGGTSMATPMVSGIAALLMASVPGASYQQVAQAIKASGVPVPSLAGITTTGKAANAMRALANLHLGITGLTDQADIVGQPLSVTFSTSGLGTLSVSASSSNASVLANSAITGQNSCTQAGSCTIQLLPAGVGTTTVSVTVKDSFGQQTTISFQLTAFSTVGIVGLTDQSGVAGQPLNITFSIAGLGPLSVSTSSSNTTVLPDSAITGQSSCTQTGSCTLQLLPATGGTTTVFVTVSDTYGNQATNSFQLTVPISEATSTPTPSGGGGGSMNWMFLLLLAAILGAVQWRNRGLES
jgi:subtilisin family serine protease